MQFNTPRSPYVIIKPFLRYKKFHFLQTHCLCYIKPVLRIRIHVFGPPGSISQRHGSGSFYHRAKIVRNTLIPTVLWIFIFEKWCNVPSKSNEQKNSLKNNFLLTSWGSLTKIAGSGSIGQRYGSVSISQRYGSGSVPIFHGTATPHKHNKVIGFRSRKHLTCKALRY
jgi:hypothetical protein